jgi:hypothetical protein
MDSNCTSIAELKKLGVAEDEMFWIDAEETIFRGHTLTLHVDRVRLETEEEMNKRIEKEERYMKNYMRLKAENEL